MNEIKEEIISYELTNGEIFEDKIEAMFWQICIDFIEKCKQENIPDSDKQKVSHGLHWHKFVTSNYDLFYNFFKKHKFYEEYCYLGGN